MALRTRLFVVSLGIFLLALVGLGPGQSLPVRLLVAVVGSVVIAYAGAHQTRRAALLLAHAAQRMAKGDLATRTRGNAPEFGLLGQSLDQLAENLDRTLLQLKVERDRLGGILQGMQEGVLLLDEGGRIVIVNPALRDMLLVGADAIGKFPGEVVRNESLKGPLEEAAVDGPAVTAEIDLVGIKPRRLLMRAVALASDPGGTLAVFVDVTDIRRLEAIRRDFVANVSHELRTPVTAIRSAAETVRGAASKDPVAAVRFIEIIERNADRLNLLVEDLLDLSRIESRDFKLTSEPVDLGVFLPYVLSLFRERAERKRLRLNALVPEGLAAVFADRRALEQVITNLVDNAVKYCPQGAEVTVSAERTSGGEEILLAVTDTGPGIDAKHHARLFERFYRVDAGRSREVGGTGLGLSIVKHLVEALGSRITVTSTVGHGCSFSFPLKPTVATALAKSA